MSLQQLEKKDETKPWKGICSPRCWTAKGSICRCKCHKQNHGKGILKKLTDIEGKINEENKRRSS